MKIPVRIFDINTKEMLYPEQATKRGIFTTLAGDVVQYQMDTRAFGLLKHCIALHMTPFTTAKGIPVWEGDACDVELQNEFGSFFKGQGVMKFNDQEHAFAVDVVYPRVAGARYSTCVLQSVRGNIFETPDIFKK